MENETPRCKSCQCHSSEICETCGWEFGCNCEGSEVCGNGCDQEEDENIEEVKPTVYLIGHDGNAFSIIAKCRQAAEKANWSSDRVSEMTSKMMSGNYDNVLTTAMEYFNVR
jgi:hypothetical protein